MSKNLHGLTDEQLHTELLRRKLLSDPIFTVSPRSEQTGNLEIGLQPGSDSLSCFCRKCSNHYRLEGEDWLKLDLLLRNNRMQNHLRTAE